jgi:two-component system chemotaxis response regulator CheY
MPESAIRILIVDDEHLTLNLHVSMVRREGYQNVEAAKNGHDALKKFLVLKPHIVFLDIEMPDLDGIDTLRAIKEFGITTQVVMISASLTSERVSAAREGGAAGFIVKPASQKRLADAVQACMKRCGQEEGDIELFILS